MKWLLLLLISINITLFVVQLKNGNESADEMEFSKINGAEDIKLLRDVVETDPDRCLVLGEIADSEALSEIKQFLTKQDVKYDLINKEEELAPSYWVYIVDPSDGSLTDKLNKMKIESYVVASGELKGRLSVGLFANIDLALDMIKTLKKQNISAELMEKRKTKNSQWISFRVAQLQDKALLIKELNALKINVGQIKEFFCKSIASEKQFP